MVCTTSFRHTPACRSRLLMKHASLLALLVVVWRGMFVAGQHEIHTALQNFKVCAVSYAFENGIELRLNATTLRKSGEWFEVTWTGVSDPQYDDVIALYVPADADVTKTAPVKFKWVARSASHLESGSGVTSFRLLNHRDSMRFAFIRGGIEVPRVAAWSQPITVVNPNEPLHGHLALTNTPSEMLVQWTTRDRISPHVKWGLAPGQLTFRSDANTSQYTKDDLCGAPTSYATSSGWINPGLLHAAVLQGLQPITKYYYTFGDEAYGFSDEYSFVTPPHVGPSSSVKFLVIADMGQAEIDGSNEMSEMPSSVNTTRLLESESEYHQLLLHNGDISYALGFVALWDVYFDQVQSLTTRMPYMTCIGNHERDWPGSGDRFNLPMDSGGECGVAYERRLRMPRPSEDEPWYSFDFGPIHFLQYSTEHNFAPGSAQHNFILSDLASVDRVKTPWLVVGGHRPVYIDSTYLHVPDGDQNVAKDLRDALEDLFVKYKVDLTLSGHHHSYQRTCPVINSSCVAANQDGAAAAPVHVVTGHAGAILTPNIVGDIPYFDVVVLEHGYMRMDVNATHFHAQALSSIDGRLMDGFTLVKAPIVEVVSVS